MPSDIARRLVAAADHGTTPEETVRAVCRELGDWLDEEATLYTAKLTSARRGPRNPSPTERAHRSAIDQLADLLRSIGRETIRG